MEDKKTYASPESYAMNGGKGPYSYAQNSIYQREAAEAAKEKINKAIADHFDIKTLSASLNSVCEADLGCSTGPNTFISVQNIIEAVKLQYISKEVHTEIPEFLVFFNDHVSNDFNTLFKSFPPNKQYIAAGVPGSFHGRLFPKESLHFIHSSFALQWLSKAPIEIMDEGSPAWNKGRIFYSNAQKEVVEAYATQFAKDIDSFLFARAQEPVVGGLLALFIPAIPDVMSNFDTFIGVLEKHFGNDIMDELFNRYTEKVAESSFFLNAKADKSIVLFVLLKRNDY
ncbi:putative s-adenosylmethionine-dependent methyltransferase [Quercus suber]|uniref:S-adenosylmethionine-dependent methyltransferase n=1 Tax=Quercus suber TaxID=58331 RepID=A0AAW0LC53_QUESU